CASGDYYGSSPFAYW
nr:immunoglobulin heavy chain junction region [Mus musculus]